MRKLLTFLLIVVFANVGKSQVSSAYLDMIKTQRIMTVAYNLQLRSDNLQSLTFKEMDGVVDIINDMSLEDAQSKSNSSFFKRNRTALSNYLDRSYIRMGCPELDPEKHKYVLPIGFIKDGNMGVFYQNWIVYGNVLNNSRLNGAERLKHVMDELAMPFVDRFKDLVKISEITHFSLMCVFLAEDFSSDHDRSDSEVLFMLIPKSELIKYLSMEYTSRELISKSIVYGANGASELKKVEIRY